MKQRAFLCLASILLTATVSFAAENKIFKTKTPMLETGKNKTPGWYNDKALGDHLGGPAENMLSNSGFEKGGTFLEDWSFSLQDGAEGTVEWDESRSKSGKHSLKITKTNSLGYIRVFSAKPLKDQAGENLSADGSFYTENSWPEYCGGFFRLDYGKGLSANRDKYEGFQAEVKLINSSGKLWQKRFLLTKKAPAKGDDVEFSIISAGNPHVIWWDDICLEDRKSAEKRFREDAAKCPPQKEKILISQDEFTKLIAADKEHEAWLEKKDGICRLLIDGSPVVPSLYKSSAKMADTIANSAPLFQKYGEKIHVVQIDFNKDLWMGKDNYNPEAAIKKVENAIREAPGMFIVLTLKINHYEDFCKDYPEDIWLNEKFEKGSGHFSHVNNWGINPKKGHHFWASYFSENYRNGIYKSSDILLKALKANGYLKRVIGFHIAGGHDAQFALRLMDYSKSALRSFRLWLKEKYGTPEKLSGAWGKNVKSFEDVNLPAFPPEDFYYNQETDKAFVDFHRFEKSEVFLLQDRFAAYLKKEAGKRILMLQWCMESMGGTQHGAHFMDLFFNSPSMDILVSQSKYTLRLPGQPLKARLPLSSFNEYNKMNLSELDVRTFVSGAGMYRGNIFDPGFRSRTETFASWQSTIRKLAGEMIAYNQGYWFFEIAPDLFNDEKLAADIKNINKDYSIVMQKPGLSVAQALVIYDEGSMFWTQLPGKRWHNIATYNNADQLFLLGYSGVPTDIVTLETLQKNPKLTEKYKLFLFLGACYMDKDKQAFLDKYLKKSGNYIVWLYGAGNISGKTGNQVEAATGFNAELDYKNHDQFLIGNIKNSQNLKMLPQPSLTFLTAYSLALGTKSYDLYFTPPKWILNNIPEEDVLSRYKDTGKCSSAVRKMNGWTSVFIGEAAGLDPVLFNSIAKKCDAFTASEPGLVINMNSRFISIHALKGGKYTVNLPFKAGNLVNMFDNSTIAKNSSSFILDAEAGASYWFLID